MRISIGKIVFTLLLLLRSNFLFAQWQQTGQLMQGDFSTVASAGNWIVVSGRYAGTGASLSTDAGESWITTNTTLVLSPLLIFSNEDTVLLAIGGTSHTISTRDRGQTWTRVDTSLGGVQVQSLAYVPGNDPLSHGVVAAASSSNGIFVSTDIGEHWFASDSGLTSLKISSLAASDTVFLAGTANKGAFRSTDKGLTWSPSNTGLTDTSISAIASLSGWTFAGGGNNLYRSSDRGESWTLGAVGVPSPILNIDLVPAPGKGIGMAVLAVTSSGYYRLAPGDSAWVLVKVPSAQTYSSYLPFALASMDTVLYATDPNEFTCSYDLGKSWRHLIDNTAYAAPTEFATGHKSSRHTHSSLYIGQSVSTNFGSRWITTHPRYNDGSHIVAFKVSSDTSSQGYDQLTAGTDSGAVEFSGDGGQTWEVLRQKSDHPLFSGSYHPFDVAALDGIVFTSLQNHTYNFNGMLGDTVAGVYRTTNEGASWEKMNTPGLTDSLVLSVDLFHTRGGGRVLFAGTWYNLFRSTNDGESWTAADTTAFRIHSGRKRLRQVQGILFLCTEGTSVAAYDSEGNVSRTYDSAGVYTSSDDGLTWNRVTGNLNATFVRGFAAVAVPEYPDRVLLAACRDAYLGKYSGDIVTSTEGGKQWTSFGAGLTVPSLSVSVGADERFVYCLGRRRPWSEAELTSVPAGGEFRPTAFRLEQNYPNPFNPKTGVRFQVPGAREAGAWGQGSGVNVKIVVYDMLGREVAVLVNERKAPGSYEVAFDGSRLASGVYFYRMTAGSYVESRKMLLVK